MDLQVRYQLDPDHVFMVHPLMPNQPVPWPLPAPLDDACRWHWDGHGTAHDTRRMRWAQFNANDDEPKGERGHMVWVAAEVLAFNCALCESTPRPLDLFT